jgi:hypothetical protein
MSNTCLMKKHFYLPILAILFVLAACNTKSEPPTVGKKVSFDRVCDRSNDGKRIAVEGFLTLPEKVSSQDTISVLLEIRSVKDVNKPGRVGVWTRYGTALNQIAPIETARRVPGSTEKAKLQDWSKAKSSYTHADLKVTANDGKSIGYLDRVRISGKVGFPSNVSVSPCVLSNPLIEKI